MKVPLFVAVQRTLDETEPEKRKGLSIQQREFYRNNLSKWVPHILDGGLEKQAIRRIEELRQEIEALRAEERSERQHRESHDVEKQDLTWQKRMGVAAIAALGLGIVSLIFQICSSKVQPATSARALPNSFRQNQSPTSALPEPELSSSTAIPSPEQAATAQPSVTPPESSDNPEN